ncbi:MAG TPA: pyridoxal 5'-phosphate synthase glutaminase subunit PdxT [Solirubrobacterales bacterium]|nr:pyridoxal 5'-phosphate synthase glutaminase subunit PdxT [Solirubrobacterales bacterium]
MAAAEAPLRIGVLACQGGFARHLTMLAGLGAAPVEVRAPQHLDGLDGLVIPGGESTTISKAIERDGLAEPIRELAGSGRPLLGTCAGMIVCDRDHLGLLDARARRNAFGRQLQSFEAELQVEGVGPEPLRAVFIRAPWIEDAGEDVEVLACFEEHPVVVRQDNVLACSFHPELTEDSRLHALLMAMATGARERGSAPASPQGESEGR